MDLDDGKGTTWRFDVDFLTSNWTCIWGRGCLGILHEPAEDLGQGCCSIGADLGDEDEGRLVSALAATLEPDRFDRHEVAQREGVFANGTLTHTRVVEGACIFFNRPGFAGGSGCALHLAALDAGEPPNEWKPSVCWQLPIKVDWADRGDGGETATLRRWTRADWGEEPGDPDAMAWCCTEGERAYVGDRPVVESLAGELQELVGREVYVELRRRLDRSVGGSG